MVHKKEEGTYHHIEKLMKEMPGFLSPRETLEYLGISKEQRISDMGLLFLHGLESNPGSSLQPEEEAGLP